MTFSQKINFIEEAIKKNMNAIDPTRLDTIKDVVLHIFHVYKEKEFDYLTIKLSHIHSSVCYYLNNNVLSRVNLNLLSIFIKHLSQYILNINFIIPNIEQVEIFNTCMQKSEIFLSRREKL